MASPEQVRPIAPDARRVREKLQAFAQSQKISDILPQDPMLKDDFPIRGLDIRGEYPMADEEDLDTLIDCPDMEADDLNELPELCLDTLPQVDLTVPSGTRPVPRHEPSVNPECKENRQRERSRSPPPRGVSVPMRSPSSKQ